jgi:hypothetical protein
MTLELERMHREIRLLRNELQIKENMLRRIEEDEQKR